MTYQGESTLPGILGHILIIIAFVSAGAAAFSYFRLHKTLMLAEASVWKRYGRLFFTIHSACIVAIFGMLFYMFANQLIEYKYIHDHSNSTMPKKYIIVAFWGGQQGSLLLWAFWHMVLGNILSRTAKTWEGSTMSVFSLVQFFVMSTLLGIHVFGYKIGESPFMLYRDADTQVAGVWSRIPEYLQYDAFFQDGSGLNMTLQNYWMIIHPPTLFLGFASVLVPFVFAVAAFMKNDLRGWVKEALPWTYFSVGILGLGILMGGAWAYESLNFGGFWAWDPVENASLVPWLTLVGSAHLMLIVRNRKRSSYTALLLTMITFILILYSTFLTRSGVLGDSSVHSFTGDGMLNQLLLFMAFFLWLSVFAIIRDRTIRRNFSIGAAILFIAALFTDFDSTLIDGTSFNLTTRGLYFLIVFFGCYLALWMGYQRSFPNLDSNDKVWSREFWIFIGSLILLFSAIQIIASTSLPVINDLLGTEFAPVADDERNAYYAQYQAPIAIVIALLIGVAQYARYKGMPFRQLFRRLIAPLLGAAVITVITLELYGFSVTEVPLIAMIFTSWFAIFASADYWLRLFKGKLGGAGPAIAHIGFALILLGTVISQAKQDVISRNHNGRNVRALSENFNDQQEAQAYWGDTTLLDNYFVAFNEKYQEANKIFYRLEFFKAEPKEYQEGDTIFYDDMVARAVRDHKASESFIKDAEQENWQLVKSPADLYTLDEWTSHQPGEKLFTLTPHVQLTPEGKAGSNEPGTQRYVEKDVFVYLKEAKLSAGEQDDHLHEPYSIDKRYRVGDTIIMPHYMLIPDSIYLLPDQRKESYRLMQKDSVWAIDFKVHPIRNRKDRGFILQARKGTAIVIYRDEMAVPDMQTIEPFDIQVGVSSLDVAVERTDSTFAIKDATFKVSMKDREHVVIKAVIFPMINLIWVGSIIMVLGTLIAVWHRIKQRKHER